MIRDFGTLPGRGCVRRATISGHGLTVSVITLGASVQDMRLEGTDHPLVLGFPTLAPYLDEGRYFGAIVGRYANRIAQGRARLDGRELHLDRNQDGRHLLHGGSDGTSTRNWMLAAHEPGMVALADHLTDGHMGFPGNMLIRATYLILPGPALRLTILATSDDETLCSFAQHSYFNLSGAATVGGHWLTVPAEHWLPVDDDRIPSGPPASVQGTHLDFRRPVRLDQRLGGPAIDHNLCLADRRRHTPREAATLRAGRLSMTLRSTEPGLQVYPANHLRPGAPGIGGAAYGAHAGIALEPQLWPDAPNHPGYPSAVLGPGQVYRQVTVMSFHDHHSG
ncbi:aldose 1-epimerase [Paracoccus halophilus]|uniref:Aldose 1-epimerase n=1 Tax=Paracoccus halophilus TaxID=376733 RepID=A0A099F9Q4_9RHOB|nr:aldose epimerase family protein [Paracoccus halophilus]KGJ06822.1 aldose epimerase [Paracoccus halophilus]SFA41322.1 aldose 1-epimerase [Paracoccus halophilus]